MNFDPEAPFDVVVPFRGHPEWLSETVESLLFQTEPIRTITLYDDDSPEDYSRQFGNSAIRYVRKPQRTGQLESLKEHQRFITGYAKERGWPAGITVHVDGDDRLYGSSALAKIRDLYRRGNTAATYGGYMIMPAGIRVLTMRAEHGIFPTSWIYSNLKTWRQELFAMGRARFPDAYHYPLRTEPGYSPAGDVSSFLPMARVAFDEGWRVRAMHETVYLWRGHPDNEQRLYRALQIAEERRVFAIVSPVKVPA